MTEYSEQKPVYVLMPRDTKGPWAKTTGPLEVDTNYISIEVDLEELKLKTGLLIDIGVDNNGGNVFTPLLGQMIITKTMPLESKARYTFPIIVKAGASIAVRGSSNKEMRNHVPVRVSVFPTSMAQDAA